MPCTPILLVYRPPTSDYRQPLFSPRNTRTTQRGLRPQPKPTLAKTQRTPRRQDRDALTLCALGVFARDISPCISISYVRCFPKSSRENKIRTGSSTNSGPSPWRIHSRDSCHSLFLLRYKQSQLTEASAMRRLVWTRASPARPSAVAKTDYSQIATLRSQ